MEEVQQAIVAGVGEAQAAHQAGHAGQIGAQAQSRPGPPPARGRWWCGSKPGGAVGGRAKRPARGEPTVGERREKSVDISDSIIMLSDMKTNNNASAKTPNNKSPKLKPNSGTGADAARQPLPAIQRLRQTRLPLQRPQEPAPPRPLLPTQLRLWREKDLRVRPPQNLKQVRDPTGQLQTVPPPDRSMGRFSPQAGPAGIGKMTL